MAKSTPMTLTESLHLELTSTDKDEFEFQGLHAPQKMGNPLNIAYGGYALATACTAAYRTVPANYHLYSMLGNYLGPAYADRPLCAKVRTVRQTRTFATRQVEISQKRDDGKQRACLIAIADFHVPEPATLMEYSKPPSKQCAHYNGLATQKEVFQKLLDDGKVSQKQLDLHSKTFALMEEHFDQRPLPDSIFAQNLFGVAKSLPTTQDNLPLTSKTTSDWVKSRERLSTPVENLASLTFLIDGAIAFMPLSFSHMWFDDIAACSSLDFALRFFKAGDEVNLEKWHLREMSTSVGSEGRTYGESWIWDEQGKAVACMSQQSIMRPPPGKGQTRAKGKL
ncbi:thioesterase-like superfamily-domain-containing protein [Phaeosphaeria sp. MPI-PUGE-AT-0046c]|nr:thioesterase-like superfamily-domain-containing protein [Phaeosphaeria sp. MPI-PUGE-AT-0046c]